jgi:hypothetical protein
LKIATEENLTYYDASYIQAATKNGFTIVTDDDKLLKKAKKYTEAITSQQVCQNRTLTLSTAKAGRFLPLRWNGMK